MRSKPRRVWIAVLANLLSAPLGYIYAGRPLRGICLGLVFFLLYGIFLWIAVVFPGVVSIVALLVTVVVGRGALVFDAGWIAARQPPDYVPRWYNRWYAYLVAVLVIWGAVELGGHALRTQVARAYRIPSAVMIPTLLIGDRILTNKVAHASRPLERFDIVVFTYPLDPSKNFVKRVVGLPGERIEIRDKHLFVDGDLLSEPYAYFEEGGSRMMSPRDNYGPFVIPESQYFVLGDNRDRSYDSRFWGPVPREEIHGIATVIYFSGTLDPLEVRWSRIGKQLE